jgi:hypothetical protein
MCQTKQDGKDELRKAQSQNGTSKKSSKSRKAQSQELPLNQTPPNKLNASSPP